MKELYEFSFGSLQIFKKRHGIRKLDGCGEKNMANTDAAEEFVNTNFANSFAHFQLYFMNYHLSKKNFFLRAFKIP